jgi:hypothetical protein
MVELCLLSLHMPLSHGVEFRPLFSYLRERQILRRSIKLIEARQAAGSYKPSITFHLLLIISCFANYHSHHPLSYF